LTINSVTKMWSRSSGGYESADGNKTTVSFTDGWQVSHSADATEPEIITAPGLPTTRDLYPDTFIRCKKVGPSIRLGPCFSIVPVEYSGDIEPGKINDNPLTKKPTIEWKSRTTQEQVDRDFYGYPITTVNGEPIEGITMDIVDQTLTIERNFSLFSPLLIHPYLHSVSSDQFPPGMYDAGLAKLVSYSAKEDESNGFNFWKVNAEIHFRWPYATSSQNAWHARARHEGFYERNGTLLTFSASPTAEFGGTAAGYAVVNSSGTIVDVVITKPGGGYVTAPTVTATGGTGATFTTTLDSSGLGEVVFVNITSGGSGYGTRIRRAVDGDKEPVQKPVLLKLDGSRETNENNALWIEKRLYGALPYNALGLI
jgi:hypothetical protein